jgi:hypothetical protein
VNQYHSSTSAPSPSVLATEVFKISIKIGFNHIIVAFAFPALVMTSRNLNQTWRDVIFKQYAADHEADVPFPVTYLINVPEWKQDIRIKIPQKIDLKTFKHSVLDFLRATGGEDPVYDGEHISVRPRKRPSSVPEHPTTGKERDDVST